LNEVLITILQIVQLLLNVFWWVIVVQAILSILIAFNVINTYNDFVASLWKGLNTITEPVYRPVRKILPDFGQIDLALFVVLIILLILSDIIIPKLAVALMTAPV
jgi:YggT family protein